MKAIRQLAVLLAASLVSASLAEVPIRAYRDINFGDSQGEVAQKILDDDTIRDRSGSRFTGQHALSAIVSYFPSGASFSTVIGGERYGVAFQFFDNKLYRIRFVSDPYSASYFDTTVKQLRDNLATVITQAHGKPTRTHAVDFFDTQAGYIRFSHQWATNADGVAYNVGIGESSSQYYAALDVEWSWMVSFIAQSEQDTKQSQQHDAAGDF